MIPIRGLFQHIPAPDVVDDEDITDKEEEERKEIDEHKERKVIHHVDSVWIKPIEEKEGIVVLHHQLRVALNDHIVGALVKLQVRMLHLPEHECLWTGEKKRKDPGEQNHQPGNKRIKIGRK